MFKIEMPDYMPAKGEWGANKKTALFFVKFGARFAFKAIYSLFILFPLYGVKLLLIALSKR
jgi:hypothetical protein